MADVKSDLVAYLRDLYDDAGRPSVRTIAAGCGVGHSTVARILAGEIRRWETLESVGVWLGADVEVLRGYWDERALPVNTQQQLLDEVRETNALLRRIVAVLERHPEREPDS